MLFQLELAPINKKSDILRGGIDMECLFAISRDFKIYDFPNFGFLGVKLMIVDKPQISNDNPL